MALKLYLFGIISTFLLSVFLCILLVFAINPYVAPTWIILLFYISLFIVFASIISLVNFYIKVNSGNHEVIFSHLFPSLRQAALISLVLVFCIFFEQIKVLNWWVAGMVLVAAGLAELYFRSKK